MNNRNTSCRAVCEENKKNAVMITTDLPAGPLRSGPARLSRAFSRRDGRTSTHTRTQTKTSKRIHCVCVYNTRRRTHTLTHTYTHTLTHTYTRENTHTHAHAHEGGRISCFFLIFDERVQHRLHRISRDVSSCCTSCASITMP